MPSPLLHPVRVLVILLPCAGHRLPFLLVAVGEGCEECFDVTICYYLELIIRALEGLQGDLQVHCLMVA